MFLPANYEAPKSTNGYMKFQDGINKFRVLSSAIVGYEYWTQENKPVRLKHSPDEIPKDIRRNEDGTPTAIKHFWAFTVWNYANEAVEILEITQKTVRDGILALVNDEEWGDPKQYDLKVTKEGKQLDTKYAVSPSPAKELSQEVASAYIATKINLNSLYEGTDPFTTPVNEEEIDLDSIPV